MLTPLTLLTFLTTLLTLSIASPISLRRTNSATSYTLTGFRTFTAQPGSTPGNSTVSFTITDNLSNHASCIYITAPTAADASSQTQFHACDNANFNFVWDGSALRLFEFYNVSGATAFSSVSGVITPVLTCYTEPGSGLPFGPGKVCETPTGQTGGHFDAMELKTV